MKLQEAYEELGIPSSTSPEDLKKHFRNLTKKYHPDVNKEPGAEDKFKKINAAYTRIQSGEPDQSDFPQGNYHGYPGNGIPNVPFINFTDFFNQTMNHQFVVDIQQQVNVSFVESVIGSEKSIKYKRDIACGPCQGQGQIPIPEDKCKTCNGAGRIVNRQGNMVYAQTCNVCNGRKKTKPCTKCNSDGCLETETTISVKIPPGIRSGNTLRLGDMGNFGGGQYSDLLLHCNVAEDPNLSLVDNDVLSTINISLLDALKGCEKSVSTIDGDKNFSIPKNIKNKEEVILPNLGLGRIGNQRVIVNVEYPTDTESLIKALE